MTLRSITGPASPPAEGPANIQTPAERPSDGWTGRRATVLAAILLLATVLLLARPVHQWLLSLFAMAEGAIRQQQAWGMLAFVLLAAFSAMVAFVTSSVLVPVAVYVWGPRLCFVLLWAGWFLGGLASYGIGRYLGRPIVARLTRPAALERQERWARARGFVLLQLAVPSDLAGYVFGLIRCPFVPFVVALAIAEVPYALGAVYLGVSFVEGRLVPLLVVGVSGVLLAVLAIRAYHRH